jgi:PAS domain S-box-containing protein
MTGAGGTDGRPVVLHVDDDRDFRELAERTLAGEHGMTVRSCASVPAALERLDEDVDCVLGTDSVSRSGGLELLEAVRERRPGLPFVLAADGDGDATATGRERETGLTRVPTDAGLERLADRVRDAVATRDRDGAETGASGGQEDGIERERDRFAALFESIPDPAVAATVGPDGPVVRAVNDAFVETFGYDRAEAVGEPLDGLIVPPERAEEAEALTERTRTGERLTREVVRRTADGRRRAFIFRNVPTGDEEVYGIYTDITDRAERERTVRRLHDATRRLIAAETDAEIAEAVLSAGRDVLGYPLVSVRYYDADRDALVPAGITDAGRELVGEPTAFERDEGLAWDCYERGEPRVIDDVTEFDASMNAGTGVRGLMMLPLGEHGTLNVAATEPGAFAETDVSVARVLAANATAALDRLARERALREREAALERRNERLDEFAGVVSHDLRNPLNTAKINLQLARELDEPDPENDRLRAAENALDRMGELVEDLLALARQGAVEETEPVELGRAARDVWGALDTGEATLTVEADDHEVEADPERLRELLENLLGNAVDHGGRSVRVGATDEGFYVADDGPGVPPEEREQVFERSYTGDDGNTGLGLTIVRRIAEAHGWTVRVVESEDGGARFELLTR